MKITREDEEKSFDEIKAVTKALAPYIKSAETGDGALSESAFFDYARIVGTIGGKYYNMNTKEFGNVVKDGGPSEKIQSNIAWIDISGPAAAAKLEFIDWNGLRFTDYFILFKKDGEWKLSGKVYDSHANN